MSPPSRDSSVHAALDQGERRVLMGVWDTTDLCSPPGPPDFELSSTADVMSWLSHLERQPEPGADVAADAEVVSFCSPPLKATKKRALPELASESVLTPAVPAAKRTLSRASDTTSFSPSLLFGGNSAAASPSLLLESVLTPVTEAGDDDVRTRLKVIQESAEASGRDSSFKWKCAFAPDPRTPPPPPPSAPAPHPHHTTPPTGTTTPPTSSWGRAATASSSAASSSSASRCSREGRAKRGCEGFECCRIVGIFVVYSRP